MPVAEIAGARTCEIPIDHPGAAAQGLLCRPDQDQRQPLLDCLEIGAQVDGATGRLANDRDLRSTVEQKLPRIDGSIRTEREADFASKFAGNIGLHALGRIRTEADSGDDVEAARFALHGRQGLGVAPAEGGGQPREEPGRTDAGYGLPAGSGLRQRPGQGIELLRVHS
jgi:hypothetical protein